jgi:hypothetical protein
MMRPILFVSIFVLKRPFQEEWRAFWQQTRKAGRDIIRAAGIEIDEIAAASSNPKTRDGSPRLTRRPGTTYHLFGRA